MKGKLLELERTVGNLEGILIVRGVKYINHKQFVDDTRLIGGTSTVITDRFKRILNLCLNASEGKINNGKSHIHGRNCSHLLLRSISKILEFPNVLDWSSFKYLEMPVSLGAPISLD